MSRDVNSLHHVTSITPKKNGRQRYVVLPAVALEQPQVNATRREWMRSFKMAGVTVDTIARTLGLGHNAVQEMIESLGYRKVCACWFPC